MKTTAKAISRAGNRFRRGKKGVARRGTPDIFICCAARIISGWAMFSTLDGGSAAVNVRGALIS